MNKYAKKRKKMIVYLSRSTRATKKFMVEVEGKIIHFGARGYEDYTTHKDVERMKRYIRRHRAMENWSKSGIKTAGFWSKWLLWTKPNLRDAIKHIESKFNITIRSNV
jgi:hypothetical protein